MRRSLTPLVALLLAGGALWLAPPAGAHALAQSSDPAPGSTVAHAPPAITITFGERPEASLSSIHVLDSSGAGFDQGKVEAVAGSPLVLRVAVRSLPKGVYTVSWRTVSAVDGHAATGAFAFGVEVAPTAATTSAVVARTSARPSAAAVLGRWTLYLGLVVVVGVAFIGGVAFPRPPRPALWLLAAGCLASIGGTGVIAVVERADAHVGWSQLLRTTVGHKLELRLAALAVLALLTVVALVVRGLGRRIVLLAAGAAGAAAMLADVDSSHAAAGSLPTVNVAVQVLHIVAVGLWIGGLGALLVATRGEPSDAKARAVRRFSTLAGVGLVVVFGTGVARAVVEIGAWGRLFDTGFGQLVLVKLALLAVLAALGARNRWRHVPAAGASLRGLRRLGSAELVAGASALLVAAALVNVAPPASARPKVAAVVRPLVLTGSDYGTTTRIRLEVSPGAAGFNRFTARVSDYDTAAPVRADIVQLGFSVPARPDVGASTLALQRVAPGVYRADGANLSIFGAWRVTVLVQHGSTSVEVPFTVTTRVPEQKVDVSRAAGIPTVYTVHLSGGRTLQTYLDPGKSGFNQLHITFIAGDGTELTVAGATASRATNAGGAGTPFTVRRLDPGHFVADVTASRGRLRVLVVGATDAGEQLPALIDMDVT